MNQFQKIVGVDELSGPTVFFDGSCPLCRSEIGHYRLKDETGALCFVDVSEPNAAIPDGLTQQQAMERFHVRTGSGALVSGAAAFVVVWAHLPSWRWAARAAALPGVLALLELGYRLFLPARPTLVAMFGKWQRLKNFRARPDDPTTLSAE
ncbi:MAG: thiol-disulfide oxidoreductase DCC family protein [Bosea sp. (in: a-proteobacteria)]